MTDISKLALALVVPGFRLDPKSNVHGIPHWSRVASNGRMLAKALDINPAIPEWFAYLHDSKRLNDDRDPDHGYRAATFALQVGYRRLVGLGGADDLDDLCTALNFHSDGHLLAPAVVQACWDADRLDLPRVWIQPDPARMCTEPGRLAAEKLPKIIYKRSSHRR